MCNDGGNISLDGGRKFITRSVVLVSEVVVRGSIQILVQLPACTLAWSPLPPVQRTVSVSSNNHTVSESVAPSNC